MQSRFSTLLALGILFSCSCISPAHAQKNDAPKIISNGLIVLKTDTAKALDVFREALLVAQSSGDMKIAAEAFLHCAETEILLDSNLAAIRHYRESAHLYEAVGMRLTAGEIYYTLGKFQSDLALFDDALRSFELSDQIAVEDSLLQLHANNLVGAGMVLTKQGELVNAQQNFVSARKIFESINDSAGIADAWNGTGVVHWKEGRNPEALEAYQKSLNIRLHLNDSLDIAASYSNIGIICRLQGKYTEGLNYYMNALGIRQRHHDKRGEAQVKFNIGSILTDMKRHEEGLVYYNESFAIKKSIGDEYGFLPYYLNVAELYGTMAQITEQENALLSGLALADSLHSMDYRRSFNRDLASFYAMTGDYTKAYTYHKKYSELKDSLISKEKNAELVRLQTEYGLEEKQRSIVQLESEQQRMLEKEERDRQLRYGLIGVVILVLAFSVFTIYRTAQLRRANSELHTSKLLIEKRDKEKEILLREVHHRVKNNLQLTSSLLNLQAREMKDTESAQALKEARDRIKTISLVHQELFSGSEFSDIHLAQYIPDVCNAVLATNNPGQHITVKYDLDNVRTSPETSVSIGLMLNEIIINALKHAFVPGKQGEIKVTCQQNEKGIHLQVSDNGKGISQNVIGGDGNGFGLKLLRSLAQRHNAELNYISEQGTTVSIFVPATHELN